MPKLAAMNVRRSAPWIIALTWIILSCDFAPAQDTQFKDAKSQISVRISLDRARLHPGEDVRLRVEIWNTSNEDLFVFRSIETRLSNALATLRLAMYKNDREVGPTMIITSDSFNSLRSTYPPLASELSQYWVALPPQHFYGGEVVMQSSQFRGLMLPGRYRIQGKYTSRGFLAQDVNNPLLHYAQELERLPYHSWVGSVETNSVWIEIIDEP